MLTANHNQSSGDDIEQGVPNSSNEFGAPTNIANSGLDYQLIDLTNNNLSLTCTVEHNGTQYQLGGHATNYEALDDDGETIYKTGVATGYTTGSIYGITNSFVELTNDSAGGDSGGPSFYLENFGYPIGTRAIMVGLSSAGMGTETTMSCGPFTNAPHDSRTYASKPEAIVNDEPNITFVGCSS